MRNIDVNIQNKEGFSALLCAAEQGFTDVVKEMLEYKEIDATLTDYEGVDALNAAKNNDHIYMKAKE